MANSRKLAAIMFTDIAGYTKIMQESENRGLELRARHREVFEKSMSAYQGEVIQYYGDGTLSIFQSCVSAVMCAMDMQRQYLTTPSIPVRIGIHLGDIILQGDDIIGNSVNIASRVESLAVPGSVLFSEKVFEEIKNHDEFPVTKLGNFHFKNDSKKRTIYAIDSPDLIVPKQKDIQGKLEKKKLSRFNQFAIVTGIILLTAAVFWSAQYFQRPATVNTLAVLPLRNRITEESQEYLADGMHEELIATLAKAGMEVKPYSTMLTYQRTDKTPKQIARELDADALVEGSVYRQDDQIRVRVQLIGSNDQYLSEPIESNAEFSNILFLYRELVEKIANEIEIVLTPEDSNALARGTAKVNGKAYDLYLQARHFYNRGTKDDLERAEKLFIEVLEVEPEFGAAHGGLVGVYILQAWGSVSQETASKNLAFHVEKAMELDPEFSEDHHQMAMIKIFLDWDWQGAIDEIQKGLVKEPNNSELYDTYCQFLWAIGRTEESVQAGEMAVEKDPLSHFARCDLSWAYFYNEQYDEALREVRKTVELHGDDCPFHNNLEFNIRLNEMEDTATNYDEIIAEMESKVKRYPNSSDPLRNMLGVAYLRNNQRDKANEIIEAFKNQDGTYFFGWLFCESGEIDLALDYLEEEYERRSFVLIYIIKTMPWIKRCLTGEPRYQALLEKMGLTDDQLSEIQL